MGQYEYRTFPSSEICGTTMLWNGDGRSDFTVAAEEKEQRL